MNAFISAILIFILHNAMVKNSSVVTFMTYKIDGTFDMNRNALNK